MGFQCAGWCVHKFPGMFVFDGWSGEINSSKGTTTAGLYPSYSFQGVGCHMIILCIQIIHQRDRILPLLICLIIDHTISRYYCSVKTVFSPHKTGNGQIVSFVLIIQTPLGLIPLFAVWSLGFTARLHFFEAGKGAEMRYSDEPE